MEEARHDPAVKRARCPRVIVEGIAVTTPRELVPFLGDPSSLIWNDMENEMDWCLCVVDLVASFERAEVKWTQLDHGLYELKKLNP